ncbi:MAG: cysteine desulfurase [Parcubacteria group bacterium]|nr:cysteine desulfurase [Parcubacteria group bacterium]
MSSFSKKNIYLDHAGGAPLDKRVFLAMKPYFSREQGNPSAIYKKGVEAKKAIGDSRAKIARAIFAHPDEIIFTSGGTEANNLAIFGVARAARELGIKKPHIITSVIEHPSVLNVCRALEKNGEAKVDYLGVDKEGIANLAQLKKAFRPETVLVSIMYANNEIGTIQPIREIAKIIRLHRKNHLVVEPLSEKSNLDVGFPSQLGNPTSKLNRYPYFHTDACQAMNYLDAHIERLGVDLLTFNGAKIYGPKGVGVLYKKRNVPLVPMLYGGGQEKGLRSGTENVPVIVGLAKAIEITRAVAEKESARQTKLRDYFITKLLDIGCPTVNGSRVTRLPNNINVSFPNIESQLMVILLDAKGVAVSAKSACSSEDEDASYVVSALGGHKWLADNSVRFSLGRETTKKEIDKTILTLSAILKKYARPVQ